MSALQDLDAINEGGGSGGRATNLSSIKESNNENSTSISSFKAAGDFSQSTSQLNANISA